MVDAVYFLISVKPLFNLGFSGLFFLRRLCTLAVGIVDYFAAKQILDTYIILLNISKFALFISSYGF
jgi:hypothetical protein